jgi:hypothetical protein
VWIRLALDQGLGVEWNRLAVRAAGGHHTIRYGTVQYLHLALAGPGRDGRHRDAPRDAPDIRRQLRLLVAHRTKELRRSAWSMQGQGPLINEEKAIVRKRPL